MMLKAAILLVCLAVSVSLTWGESGAAEPEPDAAAKSAADASNAFAADLYVRLASETSGNMFVSPGSVDVALAMAYAGAAGNTATEMAGTLHLDMPQKDVARAVGSLLKRLNDVPLFEVMEGEGRVMDFSKMKKVPAYQLSVANAIWGQKGYGFKTDFIRLLREDYQAGFNEVDFRQAETAAKLINGWVEQATEEKIKDLVPPDAITELTRMILANAVYFKSNWADKFDKGATKDGPFKLSAGKSADVPFMHQEGRYAYLENDDFQCVELPYTADALSMLVFLPRKVDGVAAFEKTLTARNLEAWAGRRKKTKVRLSLPKFKITSQFQLARPLREMGMRDAFDGAEADFSGMTSQEKLSISEVIHKTFVSVDEEGTEAAAATAVMMVGTSLPPPEEPKSFNADHPFVFLIEHNATGEILFMGRMANPQD